MIMDAFVAMFCKCDETRMIIQFVCIIFAIYLTLK